MLSAAAAAATVKPVDMKKTGSGSPASSPVLTRSPSLQSTASPQAELYRQNSFCKMQAGNGHFVTEMHLVLNLECLCSFFSL